MAGGTWSAETPMNAPPSAREWAAISYDPTINEIFLFGGRDAVGENDETWSYDPTIGMQTWTNVMPGTTPPARFQAALTRFGADLWMFGGGTGVLAAPVELGDLYQWNGVDWAPFVPGGAGLISPACGASMALAPGGTELMIFGGFGGSTDIWFYKPTTNISRKESPAAGPVARRNAIMFYDTDRDVTILSNGDDLAGGTLDDHWEWDGSTWRQYFPSQRPSGARGGAATWDPTLSKLLSAPNSFGAVSVVYDVVSQMWTKPDPTVELIAHTGSAVSFAQGAGLGRGQAIAFGGRDPSTGNLTTDMYRFVWSTLGVAPLVSGPGVVQGRIQPKLYQSAGSWVYMFGADIDPLPAYRMDIGDTVSISQQFAWPAVMRMFEFVTHVRYHKDMPAYREHVMTAGDTSFIDGAPNRLIFADNTDDTRGIRTAIPILLRSDGDRLLAVVGAADADNNTPPATPHRVTSVIESQGKVGSFAAGDGANKAGTTAILEHSGFSGVKFTQRDPDPNPVTLKLLGAQWRLKLDVDVGAGFVSRCDFVEQVVSKNPEGNTRVSLAAHMSKVAPGVIVTVRFTISLESTTS